jgi:hypothetical protein
MLFNIKDSGTFELNLRMTILKVELEDYRLIFEVQRPFGNRQYNDLFLTVMPT